MIDKGKLDLILYYVDMGIIAAKDATKIIHMLKTEELLDGPMTYYEAIKVNPKRIYLCRTLPTTNGGFISEGWIDPDYVRGILDPQYYHDDALWAPAVYNGYGQDPWYPPLIKRDELEEEKKDREEMDELQGRMGWIPASVDLSDPLEFKAVCRHEWVETLGLYKVYKDCKHCKIKFEDSEEGRREASRR